MSPTATHLAALRLVDHIQVLETTCPESIALLEAWAGVLRHRPAIGSEDGLFERLVGVLDGFIERGAFDRIEHANRSAGLHLAKGGAR